MSCAGANEDVRLTPEILCCDAVAILSERCVKYRGFEPLERYRPPLLGFSLFSNCAGSILSMREEGPAGLHLRHLSSSPSAADNKLAALASVGLSNHPACPAHIGCGEIFLDLPVHTLCTRRLLTI